MLLLLKTRRRTVLLSDRDRKAELKTKRVVLASGVVEFVQQGHENGYFLIKSNDSEDLHIYIQGRFVLSLYLVDVCIHMLYIFMTWRILRTANL